jgi:hypothetical protein
MERKHTCSRSLTPEQAPGNALAKGFTARPALDLIRGAEYATVNLSMSNNAAETKRAEK